jgi:hypothetical protein
MKDDFVWQDRYVKIDCNKKDISLRKGEESYEILKLIKDSKSPTGAIGTFLFTNLRLIWYENGNLQNNISIGYDTIIDTSEKKTESKIDVDNEVITSLCIKCKDKDNEFEFIFTCIGEKKINLKTSLTNILKIYEVGRYYRDVKVKAGDIVLFKEKKLNQLPDENILNTFNGISYINNQGNFQGILILTNLRIVWLSIQHENLNLTVPWIQINKIQPKSDSKYEKLISLSIKNYFGGNFYNFYTPKISLLDRILDDMTKAMYYYQEEPLLGVNINKLMNDDDFNNNMNKIKNDKNEKSQQQPAKKVNRIDEHFKKVVNKYFKEEDEIDNNNLNGISSIYLLNDYKNKQNNINDIVFSKELGCAIEKLPDKITIDSLWKINN